MQNCLTLDSQNCIGYTQTVDEFTDQQLRCFLCQHASTFSSICWGLSNIDNIKFHLGYHFFVKFMNSNIRSFSRGQCPHIKIMFLLLVSSWWIFWLMPNGSNLFLHYSHCWLKSASCSLTFHVASKFGFTFYFHPPEGSGLSFGFQCYGTILHTCWPFNQRLFPVKMPLCICYHFVLSF